MIKSELQPTANILKELRESLSTREREIHDKDIQDLAERLFGQRDPQTFRLEPAEVQKAQVDPISEATVEGSKVRKTLDPWDWLIAIGSIIIFVFALVVTVQMLRYPQL